MVIDPTTALVLLAGAAILILVTLVLLSARDIL